MTWRGVIPAITTPFNADLSVDHEFLKKHVNWLVEQGSTGIVALGSLGEGATLMFDEKVAILRSCVEAVGDRVPIVAGIAALSTAEAVALAKEAEKVGCKGLMVLPPYVYKGTWAEMKYHVSAVIEATGLSCMLYNNPIAYGTDFLPEQVQELANSHANLHAVKESSADVRRVTAIRALIDDRLALFVGVDDVIVEGIAAGATGWIAGVVNALPRESIDLFNMALAGKYEDARKLYEWMLPLLRLDTTFDFVQLIKLIQVEVGMGTATVRPPRLELEGARLAEIQTLIREALANRPVKIG
ncbi:MAG: dihydrodipicolinate synthase family protein [Armatimonadetes bacterium 55-13]|nr:dihydrodipicolinate synthase family protein [Armatimonadota bacterium]ODU52254.1 MAG: dihydrodipicolinate synthase family protein [bacterium SCN 57-13]OJU61747.1 MAG: dihydrodipicolinate synthase family protein [Armatimonadetes bacterium 55-13]